jgi:AP-4 complex subunit mu-1
MFSQFYVLSPRGDSIIYRNFRNEVSQSTTEVFFRNVRFYGGKQQEAPPIFESDGLHYLWIKRNGLYFTLTATANVSPSFGLELLVRVTKLFKDYCGILTEEAVRANFTLVYEVLDEVFDYGLPQSTTNDTLKPYVFNEPVVLNKQPTLDPSSIINKISFSSKTSAATNAEVPLNMQQNDNQNTVYVDIYEKISFCVSSSGQILLQTIDGSIQMKSYVPGAQPLLLQLNEDLIVNKENKPQDGQSSLHPIELDDCTFHECVQHDDFERTKSLVITPREGEVNIMNYRLTPVTMKLPFKIFPHVEFTDSRKVELLIKFRSEYAPSVNAAQVLIHIPMPSTAISVSLDSRGGVNMLGPTAPKYDHSAEYDPAEKVVRWRMRKLPGGTELTLSCRITLSEPHNAYTRKEIGPIAAMFEIPMYSTSAIQVKSLRPLNARATPPKRWVRYITRSTSYVCRL